MTSEVYGFEANVYESAARIFEQYARRDPTEGSVVQYPALRKEPFDEEFESERVKLQAYQLAFRTLKCKLCASLAACVVTGGGVRVEG